MLEPLIDRLERVRTLDDLNDEIVQLRDTLGVEHVVYHSVSSTGQQYAALTYSDDWVTRYLEQDYARIDPVVQSCVRRFHPIDWKRLEWGAKPVRAFLGEAVDSGVGHQGFSVPIRGPSGQFAVFTVSSRENDEQWAKYTNEHTRNLILASHFINQKALELERGSDLLDRASLSPRETDAMTMLALGYSRAQAADSLAISEHTLRVYIESARFKLAALNTTHAVAQAIHQGLVIL